MHVVDSANADEHGGLGRVLRQVAQRLHHSTTSTVEIVVGDGVLEIEHHRANPGRRPTPHGRGQVVSRRGYVESGPQRERAVDDVARRGNVGGLPVEQPRPDVVVQVGEVLHSWAFRVGAR